jgi:hypothetical protein
LRTATIVNTKETRQGGSTDQVSLLTVGLSAAGGILLATKIYFVRELLFFLAALAVLFAVGAGALLLCVLLQEGLRWSVRQIIEAKERSILFRGGPHSKFNFRSLTRVLKPARVASSVRVVVEHQVHFLRFSTKGVKMKKSAFRTNAILLVIVVLLVVFVSARIASQVVSAKTSASPHVQPVTASVGSSPETQQQGAPATASQADRDAAIVKAMDLAMEPGEGQKKLEPMVGNFDVRVFVWVDPSDTSKPPIESRAVAISTWVLGHRYIQQMVSGFVLGEPWSGIGYAGFDNVQGKYVACYMDNGSTGMEWYTGGMDPDGKTAKLTATEYDAMTGKPKKIEMRLSFTPDGNHQTELWEADPSGKMWKIMELQYRRQMS